MLRISVAYSVLRMKLAIIYFFDCFVAKLIWPVIHELFGVHVANDFESVWPDGG